MVDGRDLTKGQRVAGARLFDIIKGEEEYVFCLQNPSRVLVLTRIRITTNEASNYMYFSVYFVYLYSNLLHTEPIYIYTRIIPI